MTSIIFRRITVIKSAKYLFSLLMVSVLPLVRAATPVQSTEVANTQGVNDPAVDGFSPDATGSDNTKALQQAVDKGGTIVVSRPGTYRIAGTVYIGSNTTLVFGNGVFLKKVAEKGPFSHVLLNKGALNKTYDEHISIQGLQIIVNGVDFTTFKDVYGLRGQLAFFYVKDLRIEHFRCLDLGKAQFAIHVCTFEDLIINDVIIKGMKDGVHLGRGKRFTISNGIFQTADDAVALNAHDYATSNPELGWIEDGLVENCHDLQQGDNHAAYFCRILAGAWIDWKAGMEVQQSDTVVSNGRLYRVQAKADGTIYKSLTQPTHEKGTVVLDGIPWGVVQNDVTYTAGVRNVTFRDIFLEKARTAFSIHFDNGKYSRSYYPGAQIPMQKQILFEDVRVLHGDKTEFLTVGTPVDLVTIVNSSFQNNSINFHGEKAMPDYFKTKVNISGCVFNQDGPMDILLNGVPNKVVSLKTSGNTEVSDNFRANVKPGPGSVTVDSDLTGLKK